MATVVAPGPLEVLCSLDLLIFRKKSLKILKVTQDTAQKMF